MVKLRSRLIRSPFSGAGGEQASGDNNNSESSAAPQRQGRRRLNTDEAVSPRQPLEALDSSSGASSPSSTDSNRRRSRSLSLRPLRRSPAATNKRKPESRGITASIRRAKTAMLRMASSPARDADRREEGDVGLGAIGREGGGDVTPNNNNGAVGAGHDDGDYENVPPMALLSPNCGLTYYAHAGAAGFDDLNATKDDAVMDVDSLDADAGVAAEKSVLDWMKDDAPPELLPRLLSFCGSRKCAALSRVNKAWNGVMKDESIWRVMCEDTHKVRT